ncbi:hypothetical protein TRIUR3_23957 [Triticum urartu]|uniref:Uncharacterized protein n=1 Tax=Triticum urartu TaxID=4572 RepID=M7ZX30_TRIUA|nr:hypothetical protein TRIUR3_23957 [Triticum urartu]
MHRRGTKRRVGLTAGRVGGSGSHGRWISNAGPPPERRLRTNAGCRAGPQADALVVLDGDGPCVRAPAAWTKLQRGHELPIPNPGIGAYGSAVVDPERPRSAEATGSQAGHREDRTNAYGDPAVEDAEGQEHSGVVRLMGCPDGTVKIGDYMVWRHYCINGKSKVSKPLLSIQQHTAALRILPASLQLGRAHIVCGHMHNLCARRCLHRDSLQGCLKRPLLGTCIQQLCHVFPIRSVAQLLFVFDLRKGATN